jgi:hypothetical protein
MKFRPYPGKAIGIDPGGDGAIALSSNGKLIESYSFKSRSKIIGFNKNLSQIDSQWLHDALTFANLFSDRLVIESPQLLTYDGKITVSSIAKLHQTYAQIAATAELVGFVDIVHADPQNWQGYHSISKNSRQTVKQVIREYLLSQNMDLPSGVADAYMIANYVYSEPPPSKAKPKSAESGKNKIEF